MKQEAMNPRRRFPDFMASCFKMSQHRRELQIADCKLRISGLQPGVIYFASENWPEGAAQAGPGQASSPREGCKALLRGNACASPKKRARRSRSTGEACLEVALHREACPEVTLHRENYLSDSSFTTATRAHSPGTSANSPGSRRGNSVRCTGDRSDRGYGSPQSGCGSFLKNLRACQSSHSSTESAHSAAA